MSDVEEISRYSTDGYSNMKNVSIGCEGTDIIIVSLKDCLQGFYAPNAFTPGTDGKNDVFRPLLFGHVLKYELTIYNTYVWTCTYQFEGEPVKFEKGIVNLIR